MDSTLASTNPGLFAIRTGNNLGGAASALLAPDGVGCSIP